jgi:hypothetical protein
MPGINYSAHQYNPIAQGPGAAIAAAKTSGSSLDSSFGFADLLDIVNPLQHIPVISTLYRHLTGDKIGTVAKLAGDTLYGGVTGLICSAADTAMQEVTGKGFGDTVYAMAFGDEAPTTAVATAEAPAAVQPASSDPSLTSMTVAAGEKIGEIAEETAHIAIQQATKAYRSAGRLVAAY